MPPTTPPAANLPPVRLLHHLARTGGTVISQCLAVMPRVVLLSEIHPLAVAKMNPVKQVTSWYDVLTPADQRRVQANPNMPFVDAVELINRRCTERNLLLVIRDWNHLDYMGRPYIANPTGRLFTAETLAPKLRGVPFTTVRHPLDQWMSLVKLPKIETSLPLELFLKGCADFAQEAVRIGFVRYEDFTKDPAAAMKTICERLEVPFDPTFVDRWWKYTKVTGDTQGSRGGKEQIVPLERRPVAPALLERFGQNASYRRTLELLGYEHPK